MARRGRYRDYYDYYPRYPASRPLEAKGGIKAQTKRGAFGQSWWAKRWIAVLESFNIGARLSRGRSYARRGQVTDIQVGEGTIEAEVQGSRATPYSVTITVKTLSKADWKKLADALGKQALFTAKLLAGEMPENIEEAFQAAGLSLFPGKSRDLQTDCSCPDWSNPCKHIAAVYYLLGEEFDRDPFLIFRLRGLTREALVGLIGRKEKPKGKPRRTRAAPEQPGEPPPAVEPLPTEPEAFWRAASAPADLLGEVHVPPIAAALPRRLGSFPFWRAGENFLEAMERFYRTASPAGMDVFLR